MTWNAILAARAALHNRRTSIPKYKDGAVESLPVLRITRATAIRARRNALQGSGPSTDSGSGPPPEVPREPGQPPPS